MRLGLYLLRKDDSFFYALAIEPSIPVFRRGNPPDDLGEHPIPVADI
jgi:hypothetical protein